jgi:phosphate-selective porin OprO/OprP
VRRRRRSGWLGVVLGVVLAWGQGEARAEEVEARKGGEQPTPGEEVEDRGTPRIGEAVFRPGAGVSLKSEDGRFALLVGLRGQALYQLNRDSDPTPPAEAWTQSMELRRGRVVLSGHTFGEHNRYRFQLHFAPREVSGEEGQVRLSPLRDFVFIFDYLRDLTVQVGQYKVPFSRQRVISSGKLQMVDRSNTNREFTIDRDIGVEIRSEDLFGLGLMRYYAGAFMGEGAGTFQGRGLGLLTFARVEVLPLGMFDDYSEGVQSRTMKPRLSVGVGVAHIQEARGNQGILGARPADGGTTDTSHFAADILFKWWGWSLQAEVMGRWGARNPGDATDTTGAAVPVEAPRDGVGAFIQSGWSFDHGVEVSGRYGTNRPSGDSSLPQGSELGAAASWYIEGHSLKLQADYFRLWGADGVSAGDDRVRVVLQVSL